MNEITALLFAANPVNTVSLTLDEEIRVITEKISLSDNRDFIKLIPILATRPDDVLQNLNKYKPHIVHFSGHGEASGGIMLVDNNGESKLMDSKAIRSLFTTLQDNIRVVILNCCYSKNQAKHIVKTIDCAIGMDELIGNRAAITFIASFYQALGFGRSIQEAFEQGKIALLLYGIAETDVPKLYIKNGIDPSQIRLLNVKKVQPGNTTSGNNDNEKPASIELKLDQDLDKYTPEQQEKILRAIRELLGLDNVKITRIRSGSILITVELPADRAYELLQLVQQGEFKNLGITSAKFSEGDEITPVQQAGKTSSIDEADTEAKTFWQVDKLGRLTIKFSTELLQSLYSTQKSTSRGHIRSRDTLFELVLDGEMEDLNIKVIGNKVLEKSECTVIVETEIPSRGGWPHLGGSSIVLKHGEQLLALVLTDAFGIAVINNINTEVLPDLTIEIDPNPDKNQ